jgi:hypothetical protein
LWWCSTDSVVDPLSDDDRMPRTARNVLQQAISVLWQILSIDPGVRLAHDTAGYALEVAPLIDLYRFRALVAQSRGEGKGVGTAPCTGTVAG